MYTYDQANRLTKVVTGTQIFTMTYNGLGDRLTLSLNGTQTKYANDVAGGLTQVLLETTGATKNAYLYGNGHIAQQKTNVQYFGVDGLGSVRQLYNSSGQIVSDRQWDPYGNQMSKTGVGTSIYGFAGEPMDGSGLVFLRARYYAPRQARFLQHDAWQGDEVLPQTLNPYAYVRDNPVLYVDPSGYCYWFLQWIRKTPGGNINCENQENAWDILTNPNVPIFGNEGNLIDRFGHSRLGASTVWFGTWFGYVGSIIGSAAGGPCTQGALTGIYAQAEFDDLLQTQTSGATYIGNAVGGCVSGGTASLLKPVAASNAAKVFASGLLGGLSSSITRQKLENSYNLADIGFESLVWGCSGVVSEKIGGAISSKLSSIFLPNTYTILQRLATQADRTVQRSGPVAGTLKHSEFARLINALRRSDLTTEVSYLNGQTRPFGTPGSVRLDVVEGPLNAPKTVYDLKTGSATLTPARIQQIRSHLPNQGLLSNRQPIPIIEIEP